MPADNARYQSAAAAGLSIDQVRGLKLKWAFGFTRSAPTAHFWDLCFMTVEGLTAALARVLEEQSPGIVSAYLFGSHAEGRAHRESDVDVGVLLRYENYPTARVRFDARLRLSARIAAALRINQLDALGGR